MTSADDSAIKPLDLRRVEIDVGASRPFTSVFVSDAHLALADSRDNDTRKLALAASRGPWFANGARYLEEAVLKALAIGAPLLCAGDIWDFVSIANLEAARSLFAKTDWFACVGNHEFSQYVGEAREDAAYKALSADRVASVWPNDIVFASRYPEQYNLGNLKGLISYGASPRGSINLALASKAYAFMRRRGYVIPEDVRAMAMDVLRHRIGLTYEAEAENVTSEEVVNEILNRVDVP